MPYHHGKKVKKSTKNKKGKNKARRRKKQMSRKKYWWHNIREKVLFLVNTWQDFLRLLENVVRQKSSDEEISQVTIQNFLRIDYV